MKIHRHRKSSRAAVMVLLVASVAACSTQRTAISPPQEGAMRQDMARMHEQYAECLRSSQSMPECQAAMMRQCRAMMDGHGCRRMSGMMCAMGEHEAHGDEPSAPDSGK